MTDTNTPKTATEILAEATAKAQADLAKEQNRSVDQVFNDLKLADVPEDIRRVAKRDMKAKARFDDNMQLVIGKKGRTPMQWLENNFPTLLERAEKPNGNVELEAAAAACSSLAMQGELIKSMGMARAAELLALVGGRIGALTKPQPIPPDKPKARKQSSGNPFVDGDQASIAEYIRKHGARAAAAQAVIAGTDLAGRPLRKRA